MENNRGEAVEGHWAFPCGHIWLPGAGRVPKGLGATYPLFSSVLQKNILYLVVGHEILAMICSSCAML